MFTSRQIEVDLLVSAEFAVSLRSLERRILSCAVGCGSCPGKGYGVICQCPDAQTCMLDGRGAM